jgi:HEAT repeat protein
MTTRSSATEIPTLVGRLGSRRPRIVDGARARLAVIGGRAVEALAECLEGDNPRVRSRAMALLALIQDARGREPLLAMLLDRDARMREIAARCLARFPSSQAVVGLERLLKREKVLEVRVAAVQALVEQYAAGQERALRQVVEILFGVEEDPRLRIATLSLVPHLRASERRGILRRLRQDPNPEVARKAQEHEQAPDPVEVPEAAAMSALIRDLGSGDYAVWNEAVHKLAALGAAAVQPVTDEMRLRAHDPEYCVRAGMVLKALGPRRSHLLAPALEAFREPAPLQALVEVIGAIGEPSLVYGLKGLLDRLAGSRASAADAANGFDPMLRVRARAHLELARVGSRVAIGDLREALSDPGHRVDLEMLSAVEAIGKKDEIPDLLRAWLREDRFTQDRIAMALRAIMKRERIRRNNPVFQSLSPRQRRALAAILPPARPRRTGERKVKR